MNDQCLQTFLTWIFDSLICSLSAISSRVRASGYCVFSNAFSSSSICSGVNLVLFRRWYSLILLLLLLMQLVLAGVGKSLSTECPLTVDPANNNRSGRLLLAILAEIRFKCLLSFDLYFHGDMTKLLSQWGIIWAIFPQFLFNRMWQLIN